MSLEHKLAQLEIEAVNGEIFLMNRRELRERFSFLNGRIDTSRLVRNLLWQDHNLIKAEALRPVEGNIRSYWYARVKPVLARAKARGFDDKYGTVIDELRDMVVEHKVLRYADFGFMDESRNQRQLGQDNPHIWCVAEKTGHLSLLEQFHRSYGVTIYALGGQPSALGSENFVAMLKNAGLNRASCVLVSIVDFDPAGLSIIKSFINHLTAMGFKGQLRHTSLIHPARLTKKQIRLNRYPLPTSTLRSNMGQHWLSTTKGLGPYGRGYEKYGLEADAMSREQLTQLFEQEITPHLNTSLQHLKRLF